MRRGLRSSFSSCAVLLLVLLSTGSALGASLRPGQYGFMLNEARACSRGKENLFARYCNVSADVGLITGASDVRTSWRLDKTAYAARYHLRSVVRSSPPDTCSSYLVASSDCSDNSLWLAEADAATRTQWMVECEPFGVDCVLVVPARTKCPQRYLGFDRGCTLNKPALYSRDESEAVTVFNSRADNPMQCRKSGIECSYDSDCCEGVCESTRLCNYADASPPSPPPPPLPPTAPRPRPPPLRPPPPPSPPAVCPPPPKWPPASAASSKPSQGYDVILLAGQSNMSGRGLPIDEAGWDAVNPRIFQFASSGPTADTIIPAREPLLMFDTLEPNSPNRGLGPGLVFARWYSTTVPSSRRVLLVPAAKRASGFDPAVLKDSSWDVGGYPNNLFVLAVAQAKKALEAAGPGSQLVAMLWLQGEYNARRGMTAPQYAAKLDAVIDGFRAQIPGAASVPFIVGSMVPEFIAASPANKMTGGEIDTVHRATPQRRAFTAYAPGPRGCSRDALHYSAAGQRNMGYRMFQAFRQARTNRLVRAAPASKRGG